MHHIILNPVAGKGRTIEQLPRLMKAFENFNLPCKAHVTKKPGDGYDIAKMLCQHTPAPTSIIGAGGDGTIQEIVAGMVAGSGDQHPIPIPFAICPIGSGNDFVESLGTARKVFNPREFVQRIAQGKTRMVDVITANGEGFLNIANIGIDAKIVENAAKLKQRHGGRAYLAAVYKTIMKHTNTPMEIIADGQVFKGDFTIAAICNGQYYGGGLHIAPSAQFDDGKITLCLIEGISRPKLGVLFPSLLIKKHTGLKIVKFVDCTEVTITLKNEEILCLDGNLMPAKGKIRFNIRPQALEVFV